VAGAPASTAARDFVPAATAQAIAVSAGLWLVYFFYEQAIKSGLACSGDCNIRVDLLLIYPLLGVVSIIAIVVGIRSASSK